MTRKILWNGKEWDGRATFEKGLYEIGNRVDECCDLFYDGTTAEERAEGITYSDYNGGEIFIQEESTEFLRRC